MGDKTLVERVIELECRYSYLAEAILAVGEKVDVLLGSVVLVEKRKPGPAVRSVSKKVIKRGSRGGISRMTGSQVRKKWVTPDA